MRADDLYNFFERATAPIRNTLKMLTGKALIKSVDDSKPIQEVQISALAGESMDRVPRIQNFGFASNPPTDSEAIIVSLGGMRENIVVITADNRVVRFKDLASGESAIYTDDGTVIHLKKGGLVDVKAATKVMITVPDVEITGNLKVGGNLKVVGNAEVGGTSLLKGNVTVNGTVQGDKTINATIMVGAGAFSGPIGGPAGGAMVTTVPIISTAAITTTADITGGGTSLATIKTKFNSHTHPVSGSTANPTGNQL